MAGNLTVRTGKVKTFRGKLIEDFKGMDLREFVNYLTSRERRTVLRSFQVQQKFLEKSKKDIAKNRMPKTHLREMVIVPEMLGWNLGVHNGKEFVQVKVSEEMLGHRLGEFALTRKTVKHGAAGVGATRGSASLSVK